MVPINSAVEKPVLPVSCVSGEVGEVVGEVLGVETLVVKDDEVIADMDNVVGVPPLPAPFP